MTSGRQKQLSFFLTSWVVGGFARPKILTALALVTLLLSLCISLSSQTKFPSINRLPPGELLTGGSRALLPQGVALRQVYPPGVKATKLSEGWVPHLYNDAVMYCTIGYGHLIKKAPCDGTESPEFLSGLTKPRGEEILVGDLASSQYTVMTSVKVPLTDGQFAALADFVFNVGSANFRSSKLLEVVNAKQQERVPVQFRLWILAKGKPLTALKTRREREIVLYFDGIPKTRGIPQSGEDLTPIDIEKGQQRMR
jgi:lysozyme